MNANSPAMASAIFDRALLLKRRTRRAGEASRRDFLLHRAADDIADRLAVVKREFATAVVIGAHHGVLGTRLRGLARVGAVIEMEACEPLLARCGDLRLAGDEEALPFRDGSVDLVVSALTLQHVNDLPGTLAQVGRVLKPDGLFVAAFIGGQSLRELRESFLAAEAEIEGGASPRVAPFADVRDAGALLQRAGFALPVADSDAFTVTYATPLDLMRELQGMGASNALIQRRRTPLRRDTLARAMEIYGERFSAADGRIMATFEIVTMTGWSPHESQQKPLRPGSAQARLADALKADERKLSG